MKISKENMINCFLFLIIIIFLININKYNYKHAQNNSDENIYKGSIAYGVYDQNGSIIENGTTLKEGDGLLKHTVSIHQNLPDEREYLVVALVDFMQQEFYVDGTPYDCYRIKLDGNDNGNIEIEIDVSENSKELTYLVIKMPDYLLTETDIRRASIVQEIMATRINLRDGEKSIERYEDEVMVFNEGPNDTIFLSKNPEILKIEYKGIEGSEAFLSIGNLEDKVVLYAVVAFLDWQQVRINDSERVKYFEVKPGERQCLEITLPNTEIEANYQVVAFPYPYNVSLKNYSSKRVAGSFRMVVSPN